MSKYDDIGKMTFSNLNYLKKKLPTLYLSYNAHWPPFYIVLRYEADMACEILKFTINLNKDLEKVKDLFKNSSHQEKGSDKFVNTFGTLFNIENISKNVKDFLNNIYTICAYPEAYMLHSYVILNDQNFIEELFKTKSPEAKHELLKEKFKPIITDKSYTPEGYSIFKLAEKMGHDSLYNFLKQELETALCAKFNITPGESYSRRL